MIFKLMVTMNLVIEFVISGLNLIYKLFLYLYLFSIRACILQVQAHPCFNRLYGDDENKNVFNNITYTYNHTFG